MYHLYQGATDIRTVRALFFPITYAQYAYFIREGDLRSLLDLYSMSMY